MRILPIFIPHAGCDHQCVFCNQTSTSQVVGLPSTADVTALVEEAICFGRLDEVAYYGGSFTALPLELQKAFLGLLQPYLADGDIGGIRLSTRPDAVDEETLNLLRSCGVTTVELGCQSFSDQVLQATGRGHKSGDAVRSAALLQQSGMNLGLQLMPGLPGADRQEAYSSLEAALSLCPDFMRIYPTVVLESTRLADLWRQGGYQPLDLEEVVDICADFDLICRRHGVPVIRFGLQANDDLNGDAVLAGPYHPAFGQLVKSRLWQRALRLLLADGNAVFKVHPADLSDAVGHRRNNLQVLTERSPHFSVQAAPHVPRGSVMAGEIVHDMASFLIQAKG